MNSALEKLASVIGLNNAENERLRLEFGCKCAARIRHLLEEQDVIACLKSLEKYLAGEIHEGEFRHDQQRAPELANQHRGSKSIDGCGHAAVSASYAVANAINGKALQAASYSAYATVYADGGYGAVAQPEAFGPEFRWQVATLRPLAAEKGLGVRGISKPSSSVA